MSIFNKLKGILKDEDMEQQLKDRIVELEQDLRKADRYVENCTLNLNVLNTSAEIMAAHNVLLIPYFDKAITYSAGKGINQTVNKMVISRMGFEDWPAEYYDKEERRHEVRSLAEVSFISSKSLAPYNLQDFDYRLDKIVSTVPEDYFVKVGQPLILGLTPLGQAVMGKKVSTMEMGTIVEIEDFK